MTQKFLIIILSFLAIVSSFICKAQAPTLPPMDTTQPESRLNRLIHLPPLGSWSSFRYAANRILTEGEPSFLERRCELMPMSRNLDGGFYIGRTHLWRYIPGVSGLQRVSGVGANVRYDVNLPEYNMNNAAIQSMSLSPYFEMATGYVVYEDGAIFYRNTYTDNPASANKYTFKQIWNIGLPENPINDIVCHPRHPEQVWEARGSVSINNAHPFRVVYSPDAGKHWFDISKGLPKKIPVTHIVYQEGIDFVYCSTDIGIYKASMSQFSVSDSNNDRSAYNSVNWTCFNQGANGQPDFPKSNVTDFEINYPEGKLYAFNAGRAIWSTKLEENIAMQPGKKYSANSEHAKQ